MKQLQRRHSEVQARASIDEEGEGEKFIASERSHQLTRQLVHRLFAHVPLDKGSKGCFASYLPSTALMALLGYRKNHDHQITPVQGRNVERGLIEYLRDEIERIILANTSQLADELVLIRLHSLLERMVKHFGPDPVNPCFMRFLRISMKEFNYKTALYLIQSGYVKITSLADAQVRPDLLFLLLFYCRNHSSLLTSSSLTFPVEFNPQSNSTISSPNSPPIDGNSLLVLIQMLLPYSDINSYQSSHMASLLDLLVDLCESEVLDASSSNTDRRTLSVCAEITLDLIIKGSRLDIPLLIHSSNGRCNPIQRAVDSQKFTLALNLVKTTTSQCDINKLIHFPSLFIFTESAYHLLEFLYLSGFNFPPTSDLAVSLQDQVLADPNGLVKQFVTWLGERRRHPLALRALAWNVVKKHDIVSSQELLSHYVLSLDLAQYMTGESFQLLL